MYKEYMRPNTIEVGSNSFATRVYGWMTAGLLLTAIVAYWVTTTRAYISLMPYTMLLALGTLGVSLAISAGMTRFKFRTMSALFLGYSGLQGLFFGTVLPVYAASFGGDVIWTAFLTGGLIFGLAVLYGLFTKTDMTRFSKLLQIGLFGLLGITLIYGIMSLFTNVTGMMLLISYLGLILFVGLTAFDVQQIRALALQTDGNSAMARNASIMMALKMYINVIMIFWYLLQIFSRSRSR